MAEADGTRVDAAELLARALWHLAIAMAGHVLAAWEVRTFQVERGRRDERVRFFTAVGAGTCGGGEGKGGRWVWTRR